MELDLCFMVNNIGAKEERRVRQRKISQETILYDQMNKRTDGQIDRQNGDCIALRKYYYDFDLYLRIIF